MGVFLREYYNKFPKTDSTVIKAVSGIFCKRCLSEELGSDHYGRLVCPDCHAAEGDTLFRFKRELESREHVLKFSYELSKEQVKASAYLLELIKNRQSGVIHAVCGAGKTEMTYAGIIYALNHDMRICFAIPRKEIVTELCKRFKIHFPATIVKALHQDSKDDEGAHMIISTVHQLIGFFHEFDLVILDEADAFPYASNHYLHRLVKKALIPDGILIEMSATIEKRIIDTSNSNYYLSPSRFHNFDLDEPKFIQVENIRKLFMKNVLPDQVKAILDGWVSKNKPVFMFVPTIFYGEHIARILNQAGYKANSISSVSKDKDNLLMDFKRGKTDVLIATTILERGVTFNNVQVGVLFANDRIFTKSVLIQICGRVGRFTECPSGEIRFFSEYLSKAMLDAKKEIRRMNRMKKSRL